MSRTIPASVVNGGKLKTEIAIPESLTILEDPKAGPAEGCGCIRILTPEDGDKRVTWDRRCPTQVRDARKIFNRLSERGLRPFRVSSCGARADNASDVFDAAVEEYVFMPMSLVVGG